ncbi:hypothetical protein [Staphylococcus xylosus]|uniref:hypothetical protein n=1 Tax=Staphylococcus xylosus TaxID=1288 RepID=UPI002DBB7811|nr:hypothetical protein [Staphylococcus xylosus]MEB6230016.1 hypothetical protein [Staphylococcus xylosus]
MQSTNSTKIGNAYDVLFNDKKYNDLLNEVDGFLEDTFIMYQRGYRLDAIDDKQKPKLIQIENEFKQYASKRLESMVKRLEEIEKELTTEDLSNPEAELINRQNLEARLSFYDNIEIVDYIRNVDPKDIGVYELSLLQKIFDNRFTENQRNQVSSTFIQLKQSVLYPYENNDEYNKLSNDYNILRQIGMNINGAVITKDDEGYVVIKSLADRYNDHLKYAKAKKDGARYQAQYKKQYVYNK